MAEIETLSVVALLEDVPGGVYCGARPARSSRALHQAVHEVEFSDDSGQAYASLARRSDQLMRLHHEPTHQAV